jgi:predicted dehydrogenase
MTDASLRLGVVGLGWAGRQGVLAAAAVPGVEVVARKADRTLQFCYFQRHFPHNRRLQAAVAEGAIGDPYHARVFLKFNHRPAAEGITRWLQVYGQKGGALGQHASHELDLCWWWMGCPDPEWAFATRHAVYPVYDGPEGPAEDYFSGLVGLAGGATIQVDCSRWLHADSPTVVELYGSEGAIVNGALSRLEERAYAVEAVEAEPDIPHTDPPDPAPVFYYEIEHFVLAVAGRVAPEVGAGDAYRFMKMLDALYDSAGSGTRVDIG